MADNDLSKGRDRFISGKDARGTEVAGVLAKNCDFRNFSPADSSPSSSSEDRPELDASERWDSLDSLWNSLSLSELLEWLLRLLREGAKFGLALRAIMSSTVTGF